MSKKYEGDFEHNIRILDGDNWMSKKYEGEFKHNIRILEGDNWMSKKYEGDTEVGLNDKSHAVNPDAEIFHKVVRSQYSEVRAMRVTLSNWMDLKEFLRADDVTIHNYGNPKEQRYEFKSNTFSSSQLVHVGDYVVERYEWDTDRVLFEVYREYDFNKRFEDAEKTSAGSIDSRLHLTEDTMFKFVAVANKYIGRDVSSDPQNYMVTNFINDVLNAGLLIRER